MPNDPFKLSIENAILISDVSIKHKQSLFNITIADDNWAMNNP